VATAASASSSSLPGSPGLIQAQQQQQIIPSNQTTPFKLAHRSTLGTDDGNASDTHSIRSGRSLSSSISTTVRHPELHEPGLSASIVETVSAWFSNGTIDRAVQIGEIALAYNSIESIEPASIEIIRFNHFSSLEKVAPNPHFIEQLPNKEGSYTVSIPKLHKTSVAFKYQVHLDSAKADSYAPLRFVPAWKMEPTQTLFMLNYAFNSSFSSKLPEGSNSITLSNVIIIVHIDSTAAAKIVRCQASHGGVYARERHIVYWRLNDVTLTHDGPGQILKAKFITEGEPKPGNIEARWELTGEQLASVGSGISLSRMEGGDTASAATAHEGEEKDPFADESATPTPTVSWADVKAVKKLRSGTYVASGVGGD
jgi:F-BAR domain only protein